MHEQGRPRYPGRVQGSTGVALLGDSGSVNPASTSLRASGRPFDGDANSQAPAPPTDPQAVPRDGCGTFSSRGLLFDMLYDGDAVILRDIKALEPQKGRGSRRHKVESSLSLIVELFEDFTEAAPGVRRRCDRPVGAGRSATRKEQLVPLENLAPSRHPAARKGRAGQPTSSQARAQLSLTVVGFTTAVVNPPGIKLYWLSLPVDYELVKSRSSPVRKAPIKTRSGWSSRRSRLVGCLVQASIAGRPAAPEGQAGQYRGR